MSQGGTCARGRPPRPMLSPSFTLPGVDYCHMSLRQTHCWLATWPTPLHRRIQWRGVPSGGHPCACMASSKAGIAPSQVDQRTPRLLILHLLSQPSGLYTRTEGLIQTYCIISRHNYLAHVGLMVDINI